MVSAFSLLASQMFSDEEKEEILRLVEREKQWHLSVLEGLVAKAEEMLDELAAEAREEGATI